jgi:hypothetical protein
VTESLIVQGRRLQPADLQCIRQFRESHPGWSRRRLSRELALHWQWSSPLGQLKDMAARTLLVKLHQRGLIDLPPRRQTPTNRMRCGLKSTVTVEPPACPIECSLLELGPLTVSEVSAHATERAWVKAALQQFHYLGFGGAVGENLQYLVRDGQGRALACLVFGAAAWKCQARDRWIGWSAQARRRHLPLLANNQRFLILPWTRVRHLASWTLGQVMQRLSADWQRKYGHRLALVETFVEQERFAGTAYRAANWVKVGQTTGRTRQDATRSIQRPVKDVYLYPLRTDFREVLHV